MKLVWGDGVVREVSVTVTVWFMKLVWGDGVVHEVSVGCRCGS